MPEPVTLRLAHSPDSDDMVMWWPLAGLSEHGRPVPGDRGPRVDTGRFRFTLEPRDVEALNRAVRDGDDADLDVTAISCAAYAHAAGRWLITDCGGSFGEGYGPKVVVREDSPIRTVDDLRGTTLAVPGTRTTAFLTLSLLLGSTRDHPAFDHREMLFSDVPSAVLDGPAGRGGADAGLLIHEAQLTFASMGLREVADLGRLWAERTAGEPDGPLPLPLGLNVVRRDLDGRFGPGAAAEVSRILSASVRYAVGHPEESREFLRLNRGDRTEWDDPALLDRYLSMYVSDLTVSMGGRGRRAIDRLLRTAAEAGLCPDPGPAQVV